MVKNESNTAQLLILDENGERKLLDPGEEYPPKAEAPTVRKKKNKESD